MQEPIRKEETGAFPEPKLKKRRIVRILSLSVLLIAALICFFLFFGKDLLFPKNKTEDDPGKTEEKIASVMPDDEIRGVYIASVFNLNFPSRKGLSPEKLQSELDEIVEDSRTIGFDTVYFQVRPSGDALYKSEIFPTSRYLAAEEGGKMDFDPLSYLVAKAGEYDMKVVAWVNPYRVTASSADSKEEALATLSDGNPAKLHPDWTVFYGGKLYYDPALSQVRDLIAAGVREICEGYDVAGILYDDYFYPYPVAGEEFDDAASYEASGSKLSLGDFRRDNVNQMVRLTFDTVKSVSADLTFGVSPFGIWKNAASDPRGSDTHGLEAYSALYCDALAWIEGGYIDYVSPQIYWEMDNEKASFSILTRWWSAQVDGTGVSLVISHGAYRVGEYAAGGAEISQQICYARNYMGSRGSIQYGYEDIKKNTAFVRDALTSVFQEPYLEEAAVESVGVSFIRPENGLKTTDPAQFVSVRSDPNYPVYSENGKLGRTKSGLISYLFPLAMGENVLTLSQNGETYSLTVRRVSPGSGSTPALSAKMTSVKPSVSEGVVVRSGLSIPLSVKAPAGSVVTVTLGEESVLLQPKTGKTNVYTGEIAAPLIPGGEEMVPVGALRYHCTYQGKADQLEGAKVRVIPASLSASATVTRDYAYLKTSPDSSFYQDYTPASVGMKDEVLAFFDGYYQLGFGGFVAKDDVLFALGDVPSESRLDRVLHTANPEKSTFTFSLGASPALSVTVQGDRVTVDLFSTTTSLSGDIALSSRDRLFSSAAIEEGEENTTILSLRLLSPENYYGFDYAYEQGKVILSFRQPGALSEGDAPLKGKKIVIDPGHGGSDLGALGFYPDGNEKDFNLAISLALRDKIKALGAEVLMTREGDDTVTLTQRMEILTREDPDLAVSVHHNSVLETSDANAARGTLGLYWSPAGFELAGKIQKSLVSALGQRDLGIRSQELALCRNHRFPQALLEVSFICSPAEYERALRSDYADKSADAIISGILDWYRTQEAYGKGV